MESHVGALVGYIYGRITVVVHLFDYSIYGAGCWTRDEEAVAHVQFGRLYMELSQAELGIVFCATAYINLLLRGLRAIDFGPFS